MSTVPTKLLEDVGKALYGWSDDEPNEATGYTAVYESARLAAAIHEAGYRLMPNRNTLAQIIRRVDGDHTLGAAALAEAILTALEPAAASSVKEGSS